MYSYDAAFQNLTTGRAYPARRIISAVRAVLPVRSVIDIGCARGTWLREWRAQAVDDIVGVDGPYIDRGELEIESQCFVAHDLSLRFNIGRCFDLAQSLEVAEHLPPARAATFVADVVAHATVVLFSAATPGQGGENHLNEQTAEYWRALFREHGYVAIDCLRPVLARAEGIPAWYRYNLMLYAHRDAVGRISPFARQFELADEEPIPDVSPWTYRLRNSMVRLLPRPICDHLARRNARRFAARPASHKASGVG
jgi:hypothetical protein